MQLTLINFPLVRYALRAAAKDRLVLSCIGLTILGVAFSLFFGGAAVVEKEAFVSVYAGGALRLLSVIGVVLFVAFYIQRSFENRDIEYLLSRPLSRTCFILSHAVAFALIAILLAAVAGSAVAVVSYQNVTWFYALWTVSLALEVMMMSFVALFFAMVLPSATVSALVTFAFYVLARMVGQLLGIIHEGAVTWGLAPITNVVSTVIPRFDLMTQTSWLIYGPQGHEGWLFLGAQFGAFSLLILAAAVLDLKRRQF